MAREMYLVGVPKEELQPKQPTPEPPQTPRGKWANFWFYHKWAVIIGTFLTVCFILMLIQMLSRPKYDYHLVIVTETAMSGIETEEIRKALESVGEDINGDGKVSVNVENLMISQDVRFIKVTQSNQAKMSSYLAAGEVVLYAFSPTYYQTMHQALRPDDLSEDQEYYFFSDLQGYGNQKNGTVWDWQESVLRSDAKLELAPQHLYFGVRQAVGSARNSKEEQQQAIALLQKFILKDNQQKQPKP